jgi:hypothetical protein
VTIVLEGIYSDGHRTVSRIWAELTAGHVQEFPRIQQCHPGTFNVQTVREYFPPEDEKFRADARALGREDGNHIAPCARVTRINGRTITCWFYRGGHAGENILELLSEQPLASLLGVRPGDSIVLEVEEVAEGTEGMPLPPRSAEQ